MKKEKKDKHFIKKPMYPGGNRAMKAFIRKELQYPKEAHENRIEGIVRIRYTIDGEGNVIKTQVMISVGYGCDEEAQRVVELLKFHVPKNRNLKVQFHKHINIPFKMPKSNPLKMKYIITAKKDENATSYNYTIDI